MGWGARFAGVLVVGVVLSGCGSSAGPEPQVLSLATGQPTGEDAPSPAESAAPSESPAPGDRSDLPEAAREHSALGAQAFIRHYVNEYNSAMRSGETAALADLAGDGCKGCSAYVKQIRDAYAGGGSIEGGQVSVFSSVAPSLSADKEFFVEVRIKVTRERDFDTEKNLVSRFAAGEETLVYYPEWRIGRWYMKEIKAGEEK